MEDKFIKPYLEDMIRDLSTLISYPSVLSDDAKPFGQVNIDCLDRALKMMDGYGFKTTNLDNYCGYGEIGAGEEVIGVLAHLDVVPVSDTWKTNPFELTLVDGKYYGRGTSDDKGAAICALTAMRMLLDQKVNINKRIRLILGCNEENGSKCVAHYVQKEGYVDYGFTPDGDFPLVYGEKGMVAGLIKSTSQKLVNVVGGTVKNAVAANCEFTLADGVTIDEAKLKDFFTSHNISYSFTNNVLKVQGAAAHASLPQLGVNAISYGMEGLYQAGIDDELVTNYHNMISLDYNGNNLGIGLIDDYGKLTFNVGLAYKQDGMICFTLDLRTPVTCDVEQIKQTMITNSKGLITDVSVVQPLFYPLDHPNIKALLEAYRTVTNDYTNEPIVLGGGTYAKEMKGIVAFGCADVGANYHIHEDNEYVTVDSLVLQTACYYQALLNLLKI